MQALSDTLTYFVAGKTPATPSRMNIPETIRDIMRIKDWTQAELAVALETTQPTVNRWLKGSDPRGEMRDAILKLHHEASGIEKPPAGIRMVPLVGKVGAGSEAHFYAEGQLEGELVPAPEGSSKDTVAVQIEGESLGTLFNQWLVFYDEVRSPVTPDLLGRLCVVGLPDDRVLVKLIRRSKTDGLYHLLSNTEPPILDQEVVWAARVKNMTPR